jgi:hypothetical protein
MIPLASEDNDGCIAFFVLLVAVLTLIVSLAIPQRKREREEALYDREVIVNLDSESHSFITNYNHPYVLKDDNEFVLSLTDKKTGQDFTFCSSTEINIVSSIIPEYQAAEAE